MNPKAVPAPIQNMLPNVQMVPPIGIQQQSAGMMQPVQPQMMQMKPSDGQQQPPMMMMLPPGGQQQPMMMMQPPGGQQQPMMMMQPFDGQQQPMMAMQPLGGQQMMQIPPLQQSMMVMSMQPGNDYGSALQTETNNMVNLFCNHTSLSFQPTSKCFSFSIALAPSNDDCLLFIFFR